MLTTQLIINRRAAFRATLSASQTGIASLTSTKVAFANAAQNIGGNFDTTLYRWTPPAGRPCIIGFQMNMQDLVAGSLAVLQIFKNGAQVAAQPFYADAAGEVWGNLAWLDVPNGADYYEAYVYGNTAGTITVPVNVYNRFWGMVQ